MNNLIYYLASLIAVTVVLTFHEFSHAFIAVRCGDPTPKMNGRLSLNPLKHFDIFGLVMFVLVGFGWAKPVPINPYNFKNPRKGIILTSAAGVVMNYIMAFLFYPLYILIVKYIPQENMLEILIILMFLLIYRYSLAFCVFNLIPLYPLDGYNLLEGICKGRGKVIRFLRKYGYYILMGLIIESFLCNLLSDFIPFFGYINILGYIMTFAVSIFGWPISAFWGLIL